MRLGELNKELFSLLGMFEVTTDNYGQLVIYTGLRRKDTSDNPELVEYVGDHSQKCPTCDEPYEVEVEDGEDCLECQASNNQLSELSPIAVNPHPRCGVCNRTFTATGYRCAVCSAIQRDCKE